MNCFLVYIPPKDRREHIRLLFELLCKFENIEGDEFDVYTRGGRWFGQVRKWYGIGNSKWTEIEAEYKIILTSNLHEIEMIKIK
jgi:hypothetical protein